MSHSDGIQGGLVNLLVYQFNVHVSGSGYSRCGCGVTVYRCLYGTCVCVCMCVCVCFTVSILEYTHLNVFISQTYLRMYTHALFIRMYVSTKLFATVHTYVGVYSMCNRIVTS